MKVALLHSDPYHPGYRWLVEFDGEQIVVSSPDPEHDGCRALLSRGVTGKVAFLEGKTGMVRSSTIIERPAEWRMADEMKRGLRRKKYVEGGPQRAPASEMDSPKGEVQEAA